MRYVLFALLCVPVPAYAYQDTMKVAVELGGMIGSEAACGFVTSGNAIAAYVVDNINPTETQFPSLLQMFTASTLRQLADMPASGKAAHCTAVKRSAIHFKLVK